MSGSAGGLVDRDTPALAEAVALWRAHRRDASLEAYRRALRDDPTNGRVLINAARAHGQHHRVADARALLTRLVALAPVSPRVHHLVGESYRLLSLSAEAIAAFERARALGSEDPMTALELASLLERAGRLDEADEAVRQGLTLDPSRSWGVLIRGRIETRRGEPDRAESSFREVVSRAGEGTELAGEALGELALLLDASGRFDEAMSTIERMKEAQIARAGPERAAAAHVRERFERLHDDLTGADLASWSDGPDAERRVGLLCGFPRSGTTLLERMLDAHPEIESIEERDVLAGLIFPIVSAGGSADAPVAPLLRTLSRPRLKRLSRLYGDSLAEWSSGAGAGTLLLDKNPGATPMAAVFRRLAPRAGVLVALRDPRDVVLSCYLRFMRLNPLSVNYLRLDDTARRYAFELGCWARLRSLMSGWAEVRYEDLVREPEATARRAVEALGLGWDPRVMTYREGATRIVESPSYSSVAEGIYTRAVGRWRAYEDRFAPLRPILEPVMERLGYAW